ncbi:sialin-like isoform X1 [Tubulanus polymorphus]|uniref:sialin-like isoform X1 n=1 Tax=Tubulanus polymorphus TaxID=672921 RepID=UPI003DA413A9
MADERHNTVPTLSSKRYLLAYIAFFGFLWSYAMRFNMSVAIVCMVKAPTSPNESSSNDTQLTIAVNVDAERCGLTNSSLQKMKDGEFDWDRKMQGYVLSSFFWGYIITQFPAGWLADLYGSKIVFGVGVSLSSVATILLPVAARGHVYVAIFLRFIMGLGTGVIFPAMHGLWARWAPVYERTKLIAFSYSGTIVGNVFTFFVSGVLCEYTGWPSIFYLIGGLSLLWCVIWFVFVFDSPEVHPRISQIERSFILSHTSRTDHKGQVIPWLSFLKSSALWAILVAHVCNNWGSYTMMTSLPTYMKDVLYFDMKQNGIFNALPYVTMFIASIGCGVFADFMRTKFSTALVRKVLQVLAFLVPAAFLIGTGYLDCTQRMLAVTFLVIAVTFSALSRCGYTVNHVDVAPRYAGIFMGITNTCATIPGMLAPITVGNITQDRSQESWRKVFYICAAFYAFGTIIYAIFAKGEEEEWAKIEEGRSNPKSTELEPMNAANV